MLEGDYEYYQDKVLLQVSCKYMVTQSQQYKVFVALYKL